MEYTTKNVQESFTDVKERLASQDGDLTQTLAAMHDAICLLLDERKTLWSEIAELRSLIERK